ncbi:RagB/SusD family nutrient uptake outer membrane protein [Parapedobacter sp. 2B3]|uniref:RagB/SusD family nutrient uptake outer membrane protein n=1 Tax=Parapedobacter sp. 2B3 TaxID=3342381 RepID=UPI0035B61BC6
MTIKFTLRYLSCPLLIVAFTSCEQFLDEKSDKAFVLPDKVEHVQALLDYHSVMNQGFSPAGESSSTDYLLPDAVYVALREDYRHQYTWNPGPTFPNLITGSNDWATQYQMIYWCNTVLDALPNIPRSATNVAEWNYVKGQALVLRAMRFLNIASIWAQAFDANTAAQELGIPLRLEADFTQSSSRSTLLDTYNQILKDLHKSISLLPMASINCYRVSKPAAYGLLARVYLSMRQYPQAFTYADSCLQLHSELMDFNNLSPTSPTPITDLNPENILHATYQNYPHLLPGTMQIAPELINLYDTEDLRKEILFREIEPGTFTLNGQYSGGPSLFAGLSVSEALLIRAECAARAGDVTSAMADVNHLLAHRIRADEFVPMTAQSPQEVLSLVLDERRRELPFRGLRWIDVKRLNKEGAGITLTREIDGQSHHLPPGDLRYALLIPDDVVEQAGIAQNPRQ